MTQMLDRQGGQVAYDVQGNEGQLVVCVPGMGDVRQQYRLLAPRLVEAGYRVALMDLRGHGESSTTFTELTPEAVGTDIVALVEREGRGRPAVVIGNSMAAASANWAAAQAPALIESVVLSGPFVRDPPTPWLKAVMMKVMLALAFLRPWGPSMWGVYYRSLYPSVAPADLDAYVGNLVASLRETGRLEALRALMRAPKGACEARLPEVKARALIVMGSKDPDFADPVAESKWIESHQRAEVMIVDGAGHYPHVEFAESVAARIVQFLVADRRSAA